MDLPWNTYRDLPGSIGNQKVKTHLSVLKGGCLQFFGLLPVYFTPSVHQLIIVSGKNGTQDGPRTFLASNVDVYLVVRTGTSSWNRRQAGIGRKSRERLLLRT